MCVSKVDESMPTTDIWETRTRISEPWSTLGRSQSFVYSYGDLDAQISGLSIFKSLSLITVTQGLGSPHEELVGTGS